MIIGIDGNEANQKIRVGSGVYAYNLLWQIYRQCQMSNVKCQIYLKEKPREDLPNEKENWQYKIIGPKKLWTQIGLPITLWKEKITGNVPDVFFSPIHYAPRFCPIPSVITIFDLSFIRFPEMFRKKDLYQLKNWTDYSIKQAKKIITISEFSKREIVDYYKVHPDKIVVAYPGYDKDKYKISNIKNKKYPFGKLRTGILKIKNKYKIDGDYILFVGTIQPRKNLVRLLEAFTNLVRKANPNQVRLNLVICGMIKEGRGGWMQNEIFAKLKTQSSKLKTNVIITGYIEEEDLPYLMAGAQALVMPSLYEGFGIPVVEAMACGIPVVVSNTSSLPEVVADAGILVDPYNVDSITFGLQEACYNKSRRQTLEKKASEQVKRFNWENSAKLILEALNSVI